MGRKGQRLADSVRNIFAGQVVFALFSGVVMAVHVRIWREFSFSLCGGCRDV